MPLKIQLSTISPEKFSYQLYPFKNSVINYIPLRIQLSFIFPLIKLLSTISPYLWSYHHDYSEYIPISTSYPFHLIGDKIIVHHLFISSLRKK